VRLNDLETRLAGLDGSGRWTLGGGELGVPAAQTLFEENLPAATLALDEAKGDPAALRAEGKLTLPGVGSGKPLSASVTFEADHGAGVITGVEVLADLDLWKLVTKTIAADMSFLEAKLDALRYVLSARPGSSGGKAEAGVGLQGDLKFELEGRPQLLTLTAEAPRKAAGGIGGEPNWSLEADVDLPLAELGELAAALATGMKAEEFELPSELKRIGPKLRHIRLIGSPTQGLVAACAEVEVFDEWNVIAKKCELREGRVFFTVISPTTSPRLQAFLEATLELGGVPLSGAVSVPELEIEAWLAAPVSAANLFETYLPAAAIPLELTNAGLDVGREGGDWAWSARFGVAPGLPGGWKLPGGVSLTEVDVEIADAGGGPSAKVQAMLEIGKAARLVLRGSFDAATETWSLAGSAVGDIEAGEALAALGKKFDVDLPAPLAKLDLTTIDLSLESGKATKFEFECAGDFPLAGTKASFTTKLGLSFETDPKSGKSQYSLTPSATLKLTLPGGKQGSPAETMDFEVAFAKTASDTRFTAKWEDSEPLSLARVLGALDVDVAAVPAGLLPAVKKVSFGYDITQETLVLAIETAETGSVWCLTTPPGGKATMAALVKAKTAFRLTEVPIVGPQVPPADDVALEAVELLLCSGPLSGVEVGKLNEFIPAGLPAFPPGGLPEATALLTVSYLFGGVAQKPLALPLAGGSEATTPSTATPALPAPAAKPTAAVEPAPAGPPTAWLKPQRTFGPLTLERVGASYAEGDLWLLLDGGLSAGGLSLGLEGLGVGFPLSSEGPWWPRVKLRGIGVGYSAPPLEIAGALLFVTPKPPVEFEVAGLLSAGTGDFTMSAIGAYAETETGPSMFALGGITGDLGGPPAAFVTGLAAGFGYQSALRLPHQDEVGAFPLVVALADPGAFARKDPLDALTEIVEAPDPWISWQPGSLWLAAGVQFSSFDLVSTTAVLVAELGTDLTIALLGRSTATFPRGASAADTYAKVVLDLEAVFRPHEGSFEAAALLAPGSFVIDPACALTGGFAFSLWYGPSKHAGDFVVTLGGYHPAFSPPAWYPREPRLGFSWSVRDELTISGAAYFALTPSAVMAGGALDVAYHAGDLKAWLRAYADALIWFEPFSFDLEIGISVGVSYTLSVLGVSKTLSAELGAELHLWGPPTAGEVTIHWWVISFSVAFGEGKPLEREALKWAEFEELLPPPREAIQVTPVAEVRAPSEGDWIAAAHGFAFRTTAAMPATELRGGSAGAHSEKVDGKLSIQPMQAAGVSAVHTVKVTRSGKEIELEDWKLTPVIHAVPKALWGEGDGGQLEDGEKQLVPAQLVGYTVAAPPPTSGGGPEAVEDPAAMAADPLAPGGLPIAPGDVATGPVADADEGSIARIAAAIGERGSARDALLTGLTELGRTKLPDDSLEAFAARAGHTFSDPPLVVSS
jgi:hypothetical protein